MTCSAFHIRAALPDDMPLLKALVHAQDDGYFERCFAEQAQGKRAIFVALKESGVAGYVFLNWQPRYQPFRRLSIPEIQDLFVSAQERRQGIGEALVQACEQCAREKGMEQMGIAVGLHAGFGAAQRLYARLGYVPDGAGVMHDREAVRVGEMRAIDDDLTLMMIRAL